MPKFRVILPVCHGSSFLGTYEGRSVMSSEPEGALEEDSVIR